MPKMYPKILGLFLLCLIGSKGFSFPLTYGHYKGHGQIENQIYSVGLTVSSPIDRVISFETYYTLSDGQTKKWNFSFKETTPTQYQVIFNGFIVGSGSCHTENKSCSYSIPYSKEKLEETFIIKNSKLIRYGSKWLDNKKTSWTEEYTFSPNRRLSF